MLWILPCVIASMWAMDLLLSFADSLFEFGKPRIPALKPQQKKVLFAHTQKTLAIAMALQSNKMIGKFKSENEADEML